MGRKWGRFLTPFFDPLSQAGRIKRPPKSIAKRGSFQSINLRNARIVGRKMIQKCLSNANGKKIAEYLPLFFQVNFGEGPILGPPPGPIFYPPFSGHFQYCPKMGKKALKMAKSGKKQLKMGKKHKKLLKTTKNSEKQPKMTKNS